MRNELWHSISPYILLIRIIDLDKIIFLFILTKEVTKISLR